MAGGSRSACWPARRSSFLPTSVSTRCPRTRKRPRTPRGTCVATMTGFLPIDALLHLANIGTLFAFLIVCAAVLIMRRTNPDATRPFRAPLYPFVPILGILSCLMLMFSLPVENWYRLIAWMLLGFVIYFAYGYKHSELRQREEARIATGGRRRR